MQHRRLTGIALALVLLATTLTSCSSTLTPKQVTKALETIAAHATDQIIEIRIDTDQAGPGQSVQATVFESGQVKSYNYIDGEVSLDTFPQTAETLGNPKPPSQWDIEAIMASYPDSCPNARFTARSLPHDKYLVDISCDHRWVATIVDGHRFEPVTDWTQPDTLAMFMNEAQLLTGTPIFYSFSFVSYGETAISFETTTGYQANGEACTRANYTRFLELFANSMVNAEVCFDKSGRETPMWFQLRDIDPQQLSRVFDKAAQESGQPLSEIKYLEIRTTPLPGELISSRPYVFAMWYTDEPQTSYKIALGLDAQVLFVEQYP